MNNTIEKGITEKSLELVLNSFPEWLKEQKINAWEIYKTQSKDNLRKEKFKDVIESLEIENISFKNGFSENNKTNFWGDLSAFSSLTGKNSLNEELAKKGVIFKSLKDALVENESLVKPYLLKTRLTDKDSRFTALAEALWTDGILLYIPKDTDVSIPVHLLKNIAEGNTQSYYKTLIIVEDRSNLTLIDEFYSENTNDFFLVSGLTEFYLKNSANVVYLHLQNYDYNAFNFSLQKAVLEKDAQLKLLSVSLGSQFSYENIRTYMEKEGSNAKILGLVVGDQEQVFQHETLQYHPVSSAMSDLHFEVMLKGKSESAHNGYVQIEKTAQKTDAHQLIRNLLLSKKAKAEAIPNLEILADDVKCSHGVSLGPVNYEELFYLMSRGFSKDEAQNLVIEGHIQNIINDFHEEIIDEDDEDENSLETQTLGTKVRDYILGTLAKRG
ncbi:MAG: Fe-S cluster assembly protein SufD [Candidatus Sericytochromatia bacterium]